MEIFNIYWNSYKGKENYIIGWLIYENHWFFKYNDKIIKKAIKEGFRPFPDLVDITKRYDSEVLFSTFRLRYSNDNLDSMKNSLGDLLTDNIVIKHVKTLGMKK